MAAAARARLCVGLARPLLALRGCAGQRRPLSSAPSAPRVVVVTGGAKGIGRGICEAFLRREPDTRVVCFDTDAAAGEAFDAAQPNVTFLPVDVSSQSECVAAVAQVESRFEGIDVLVNNAAVQPPESCVPIHELSNEHWDRLLRVNLFSAFYLCKAAIPGMLRAAGGSASTGPGGASKVILNIASVQGVQSQQAVPAYAATKGGLLSLTRQMAMDYSGQGIRVLAINPGTIRTELVEALLEAQGMSVAEAGTPYPLGRVGEQSEVGEVAVFLASPRASFMTGVGINVDGGIVAKGSWF